MRFEVKGTTTSEGIRTFYLVQRGSGILLKEILPGGQEFDVLFVTSIGLLLIEGMTSVLAGFPVDECGRIKILNNQ